MILTDHMPGTPAIAYDRSGEGPPVLFLHGIGGNRSQWRDQLDAVAARYTAIAWDARGYGASDDYDGALEFADFSADLLRLLDHLEIEKAHLVGLSMGARILLDFAPQNLSRVATLTLCNFFYGFDESMTDEKRAEFIALRQKPLLEGKTLRDIAPALAASLLGSDASPAVRDRLIASIEALHPDSYLKTLAATIGYNRGANLSALKVPVQLIYGEQDRLTPPAIGRDALQKLPDGRLDLIAGAGHLSNIEAPDAFTKILDRFLDDHATAAQWKVKPC